MFPGRQEDGRTDRQTHRRTDSFKKMKSLYVSDSLTNYSSRDEIKRGPPSGHPHPPGWTFLVYTARFRATKSIQSGNNRKQLTMKTSVMKRSAHELVTAIAMPRVQLCAQLRHEHCRCAEMWCWIVNELISDDRMMLIPGGLDFSGRRFQFRPLRYIISLSRRRVIGLCLKGTLHTFASLNVAPPRVAAVP